MRSRRFGAVTFAGILILVCGCSHVPDKKASNAEEALATLVARLTDLTTVDPTTKSDDDAHDAVAECTTVLTELQRALDSLGTLTPEQATKIDGIKKQIQAVVTNTATIRDSLALTDMQRAKDLADVHLKVASLGEAISALRLQKDPDTWSVIGTNSIGCNLHIALGCAV